VALHVGIEGLDVKMAIELVDLPQNRESLWGFPMSILAQVLFEKIVNLLEDVFRHHVKRR
jgi:hypothetical protein